MGASVATVNNATEIRLLAERQMGEFLKAMPKNDGGRPEKTGSDARPVSAKPETLREIGITKKQSHVATKPARPSVEQPDAEPSKPGPSEIAVSFVVPPQPETRSATQRPVLCGICVALSPSEERWCPEWGSNPHGCEATGF